MNPKEEESLILRSKYPFAVDKYVELFEIKIIYLLIEKYRTCIRLGAGFIRLLVFFGR